MISLLILRLTDAFWVFAHFYHLLSMCHICLFKKQCKHSVYILMEAKRLGSVTEACKRLGVPRRTYYYWYNKWKNNRKTLKSLMDQPRTPKSHKNDPDEELASLVIQLRLGLMYGENQLRIILLRDYDIRVSVHGVHNILSRAGLLEKRKKKIRKDRKLNGELIQMDVKHWKRSAYQYDIIDCCTRIKFKFTYKYMNANVTVDFLEKVARFYAPAFKIKCIQTDNGTEFINNQFCEEDCLDYNTCRPHSMLDNMAPVEFLQSLEGYKNACPDFFVLY